MDHFIGTMGVMRRELLLARAGLAVPAGTVPPMPSVPPVPPRTEFVYEAVVDIAPLVPLGNAPLGEPRMVQITGGSFLRPRIRGKVLLGGADRQLVRKGGVW